MNEYRVTVETLHEAYEYTIIADSESDAIEEAEALAMNDGMSGWSQTYTRTERLS